MEKRYHRNIMKTLDKAEFSMLNVVWEGKPHSLSFLFVNANLGAWCFLFLTFLLSEMNVKEFFTSYLLFLPLCVLIALVRVLYLYMRSTYFVTTDGPVVRQGKKYYLLHWHDLRSEEIFYYRRGIEWIFGCRTVEFTRSYINSRNKDSWKYKARFWCVRDYLKIMELVQNYKEGGTVVLH